MGNHSVKKQIDPDDIPNEEESPNEIPDEEDSPDEIPDEEDSVESVPNEHAKAVCSSSNAFTQQLYHQMSIGKSGEKENLILSGFGLSTAMAMIFLAARDEAFDEIQKSFRFPRDLEEHKSGYKDILRHLASFNTKLNIGQKIFADNKLDIPESFTADIKDSFGAEPTKLDLTKPASTDIINKWVKEATKGKIESIVEGEELNLNTIMILLNAIYFKCDWEKKFDSDDTREQDFYLSGDEEGPKVKVQMMTLNDVDLRSIFIKNLDARAVELPYKGNRFSMVIILPEKKESFDEMEQRLRDVDLNNELSFSQDKTEFYLQIPKFKAECTHDLKKPLQSLGVITAFVSGRSNFGGISKQPNQESFLTTVRQKAVIEVDENGTEAAAATMVFGARNCISNSFICNRPFIFLIREQTSGLCLFIGRMMNPAQK